MAGVALFCEVGRRVILIFIIPSTKIHDFVSIQAFRYSITVMSF